MCFTEVEGSLERYASRRRRLDADCGDRSSEAIVGISVCSSAVSWRG